MSKDNQIISYLIEIKESVAKLETKMTDVQTLVPRVAHLEKEELKNKTALKTVRWILGCVLVGAPSVAVAVVKILEYVKT